MVRLSDRGWSAPRIAQHVGREVDIVRGWLQRFLEGGFAALADRPRSGRPAKGSDADIAAVRALVQAGGRVWTAAELAEWLAQTRGVRLSADRMRRRLNAADLRWRRTRGTSAHRQDPDARAQARAELVVLEKGQRRA